MVINRFAYCLLALVVGFSAKAATIGDFKGPVSTLRDWSQPERQWILAADHSAYWLSAAGVVKAGQFSAVDSRCFTPTQEFESYVLVYPYVVGLKRVCLIDEDRRQIRLLGESSVPDNA